MKKKYGFVIFGLVVLICILLILNFSKATKYPISQVCIDTSCFQVEVADTFFTQEKGLMNREKLSQDQGMLFIFKNPDIYTFWMKNTLIPLDIIWIDQNQKIVDITKNATACNTETCPEFKSSQHVKYVLEINAGISQEKKFQTGQMVEFKK